ncbi:uncharacterized protein MONBRDRAFT_23733 [Monosiga brevicollis MX1]|uniref:Uncharacterized protein n=1 Tax=Monosiga brevicollis TaxID=81824 RepID=A9UUA4_MONBE|nr:uncharacterized protein MONBRDRAFT_23733 [Monosiga brevicollis MX1]EDQ91632.1 predicted protein [Monosiga brevicollis MX1]|eukprot:XP_001744054.1 hypothetical protein [Monosiga brevicollis MX1]
MALDGAQSRIAGKHDVFDGCNGLADKGARIPSVLVQPRTNQKEEKFYAARDNDIYSIILFNNFLCVIVVNCINFDFDYISAELSLEMKTTTPKAPSVRMEGNFAAYYEQQRLRAISATEEAIRERRAIRDTYESVHTTLGELPKRVAHPIMVPFGRKAFMPGKLVHCNELTVLIGDNYFLRRTSYQTQDIIQRRLTELDKALEQLQHEMEGLQLRSDVMHEGKGQGANTDFLDICEPLDEPFNERPTGKTHANEPPVTQAPVKAVQPSPNPTSGTKPPRPAPPQAKTTPAVSSPAAGSAPEQPAEPVSTTNNQDSTHQKQAWGDALASWLARAAELEALEDELDSDDYDEEEGLEERARLEMAGLHVPERTPAQQAAILNDFAEYDKFMDEATARAEAAQSSPASTRSAPTANHPTSTASTKTIKFRSSAPSQPVTSATTLAKAQPQAQVVFASPADVAAAAAGGGSSSSGPVKRVSFDGQVQPESHPPPPHRSGSILKNVPIRPGTVPDPVQKPQRPPPPRDHSHSVLLKAAASPATASDQFHTNASAAPSRPPPPNRGNPAIAGQVVERASAGAVTERVAERKGNPTLQGRVSERTPTQRDPNHRDLAGRSVFERDMSTRQILTAQAQAALAETALLERMAHEHDDAPFVPPEDPAEGVPVVQAGALRAQKPAKKKGSLFRQQMQSQYVMWLIVVLSGLLILLSLVSLCLVRFVIQTPEQGEQQNIDAPQPRQAAAMPSAEDDPQATPHPDASSTPSTSPTPAPTPAMDSLTSISLPVFGFVPTPMGPVYGYWSAKQEARDLAAFAPPPPTMSRAQSRRAGGLWPSEHTNRTARLDVPSPHPRPPAPSPRGTPAPLDDANQPRMFDRVPDAALALRALAESLDLIFVAFIVAALGASELLQVDLSEYVDVDLTERDVMVLLDTLVTMAMDDIIMYYLLYILYQGAVAYY